MVAGSSRGIVFGAKIAGEFCKIDGENKVYVILKVSAASSARILSR